MTQQHHGSTSASDYRRMLFIEIEGVFEKVKARIIEPYVPPVPQVKFAELATVDAPSHFHHKGYASYKAQVKLLFNLREDYIEFMVYARNRVKFYDERGNIFIGAAESIAPQAHEAMKRYSVELTLALVRKDEYDTADRVRFQDIFYIEDGNGHSSGDKHNFESSIKRLANKGIISTINPDGTPVLYFRPEDYASRAEFITLMNRARKNLERLIRE